MNIIQLFTIIKLKITKYFKIFLLKTGQRNHELITPLMGINDNLPIETMREFSIKIFGQEVDFNTVDWHRDYISGHIYPQKRFDTIKYSIFYNQGIEIKFPWELSRFQFGVDLALCYRSSKDKKYYGIFRNLALDWIKNNPFLTGINWSCTMDVAIRAANWIITANMFGAIFWVDKDFKCKLSKSLYNHAWYIEKFPEKFINGDNNHLISDYSGLFVLGLSFIHTNKGKRWLKIAKDGLELCMKKQIFNDGVGFENSIPYHRLVLELLSVPVILGRNMNIEFSNAYYIKLFKMFEFVSAYIDSGGNAPQIGDNDNGRFMKFSYSEEQNHYYLLETGNLIFEYNFNIDPSRQHLLPIIQNNVNKIPLSETGIIPRKCNQSVFFTEGGHYYLKNSLFSLAVYCPNDNTGGHRHFDSGSFTLSCRGIPIVVDPGTGFYTSNLQIRQCMRDYPSHNIYYKEKQNLNNNDYFGVHVDMDAKVVFYSDTMIRIRIIFDKKLSVERSFTLSDRSLIIQDHIFGNPEQLLSAIHFLENDIGEIKDNKLIIKDVEITVSGARSIFKEKYFYSPSYSLLDEKEKIVILPSNSLTIQFR